MSIYWEKSIFTQHISAEIGPETFFIYIDCQSEPAFVAWYSDITQTAIIPHYAVSNTKLVMVDLI